MSVRIVTLFGEEIIPEPAKKKSRNRKAASATEVQPPTEEEAASGNVVPAAKATLPAAARKRDTPVRKKKKIEKGDEIQVLRNWAAEKQYYTIGETARLFAVNVSHIRFWTTEFKLKVRTTRKRDRLYSPDNIQELRFIYHLIKEKGFTIPGAKAKLKEDKATVAAPAGLKDALLKMKAELEVLRELLAK